MIDAKTLMSLLGLQEEKNRHKSMQSIPNRSHAQPPFVACKVESHSEDAHVAYMFFARLDADLHAQSVIIKQKFLLRSSGGSLSRVSALLVG